MTFSLSWTLYPVKLPAPASIVALADVYIPLPLVLGNLFSKKKKKKMLQRDSSASVATRTVVRRVREVGAQENGAREQQQHRVKIEKKKSRRILVALPQSFVHCAQEGSTKSMADVWVLVKLLSCTCWNEVKVLMLPHLSQYGSSPQWFDLNCTNPGNRVRFPATPNPLFSSQLLMCPLDQRGAPPSPSPTFTIR